VFFGTGQDKASSIWKVSIDGGEPIQLTKTGASRPLPSPKGDTFICEYDETSSNPKLALISVNGGEPLKALDFPNLLKTAVVQWDQNGEGLIYRDTKNRVDNLYSQMLNGGPPRQLTDFKSDEIFAFDWSQDGKNLVLARGKSGSDVVLITSFR
jgi:Tol biopolymer transport system component